MLSTKSREQPDGSPCTLYLFPARQRQRQRPSRHRNRLLLSTPPTARHCRCACMMACNAADPAWGWAVGPAVPVRQAIIRVGEFPKDSGFGGNMGVITKLVTYIFEICFILKVLLLGCLHNDETWLGRGYYFGSACGQNTRPLGRAPKTDQQKNWREGRGIVGKFCSKSTKIEGPPS